jgi:hypothetical protein
MEAHAAQFGGVVAVVGQHQRVRKVRAAGLAGMLEPVIDALFGQQALDEGQVASPGTGVVRLRRAYWLASPSDQRQAGASPL